MKNQTAAGPHIFHALPWRLLQTAVVFWLQLAECEPAIAAVSRCRERGQPAFVLINRSDAVAVIEKSESLVLDRLQGPGVVRFKFRFEKMIKPSLRQTGGGNDETAYFLHAGPGLLGRRRFIVFLTQLRPHRWRADECEYLEILQNGDVPDACNAVDDLFAGQKYERERLCLLNYAGTLPEAKLLSELEKEIKDKESFEGRAKIAENMRWNPEARYQLLFMTMEGKERREFFGNTYRQDVPIKTYLKSDALDKDELSSRLRKGSHFNFHGVWERGSFVIDSIDFGLSSRHGKREQRNAEEWRAR